MEEIEINKKIKDLKKFIKEKTDLGTANYLGKEIREICGIVETKQLNLCGVSCSYTILYHNQEWEEFDGTLEEAIEHLKADRRYKNYGRNGATIFKGKDIYSIADKQTETIHI